MYTLWTKGLDEDQKKEWYTNVSVAKPVLSRVLEILESNINDSERTMRSKSTFDKAAWPYLQADCLGEQRAYNKLKDLINNLYRGQKDS